MGRPTPAEFLKGLDRHDTRPLARRLPHIVEPTRALLGYAISECDLCMTPEVLHKYVIACCEPLEVPDSQNLYQWARRYFSKEWAEYQELKRGSA